MINPTLLHAAPDATAETVATDLEGTLSSGETWRAMRAYLEANGYEQRFKQFLRKNLFGIIRFRFGLIDSMRFKENWVLGILALFEGFSAEQLDEMAQFVVDKELWPNLRQDVVAELASHHARGRRILIVSGMNEPVLAAFARRLGTLDGLGAIDAIGTPLAYEDGQFTGQIIGKMNVGALKAAQLEPFMRAGRVAAAYGDTERDIEMLAAAEEPVAVYPDAVLRQTAEQNGWRILEETTTL